MQDRGSSDQRLLDEVRMLRQRVAELERANAECRQSIQAAKESEKAYRTLVETAPDFIVRVDSAHNIVFINHTAPGFSVEETIGASVYDYLAPDHRDVARTSIERVFDTGQPDAYDVVGKGPDGVDAWYTTRIGPIEEDGDVVGVILIATDVTEHKRTEQALMESERRYRRMVSTLTDALFVVTPEETIVDVNPAACSMHGYRREELLGMHATALVHPDFHHVCRSFRQSCLDAEPFPVHTVDVRKDGSTFPTDVFGTKVEYDGEPHFLVIVRDASSQEKSETAAREAETRYHTLFESAGDAIFIGEVSGQGLRFVDCNTRALSIFGGTRDEIIGRTPLELSPPKQPDGCPSADVAAAIVDAVMAGNARRFEWQHCRVDGTPFDAEVTLSRIEWAGRPHVMGVVRDISHRKRAEKALSESEQRFRSLVETAPSVILCLTPEGKISEFNPEAERVYGRPREQVLGQSYLELFIPEGFQDAVAADIKKVLHGEPTRGMENPVHTADGNERILSWHVDRLLDERGRPTGIIAIGQDVTERKKAEQALRFTQFSVDRAADAVFWIENNARFTYVNDTACQTLGYSREELLSMTVHDVDPEFPPKAWASHWQTLKTHGAMTFESQHRAKDGRVFPVEISIRLLEFEGLEYSIAYARDITERKQAEQRFRLAAQVASDLIYEWDVHDDTLQWFGPLDEALGYGAGEIPRTIDGWVHLMHPDDVARLTDSVERHRTSTEPINQEYRMRHRDGSWRYWIERGTPILDKQGRPIRWIGACVDVTERRNAEKALHESESKLRAVFENAIDGFLVANTKSLQFYAANRAICEMLGYETGEILQLSVLDIHPQEALPYVIEQFDRQARGEIDVARDIPVRRKDGSVFFVDVSSGSVTLSDTDYQIGVFRDVTERKQAEEEIHMLNVSLERRVKQRTEELQAANEELNAFAYSVSHDLRAPLRAMEGFANALLEDYEDRLDQEGREYCQHIVHSAERMDVLINDLLSYSRLGRAELRMQSINLEHAVRDAIEQLESEITESKASVTVEGVFPNLTIHYSILVQVLANLISNSLKFVAPDVTPEVKIWAEPREDAVRLWVEDNGIGIDATYQERIFRVFDRLHGIETYPGTGIGLAIVARAVGRLGGKCGVESSSGLGSRFWVEFSAKEEGSG